MCSHRWRLEVKVLQIESIAVSEAVLLVRGVYWKTHAKYPLAWGGRRSGPG